ncbi:MAG: response regulator transcription factor [Rhodothermales bacterium]
MYGSMQHSSYDTVAISASIPTKEPIRKRILVVDDHPIVRQGLAQFINQERDMTVCAEASDGFEAMTAIEQASPDLVIVDIQMEGINGMDLVRNVKAQYPDLPVLMLSMHDESLYAERALRAGARGYVMKQEDPRNVIHAIRRVLRGEVYVSDQAASKILKLLSGGADHASPVDRLSNRELEVLRMIGEGYRTRHIAEKLTLSTKTVESYKARLKQKILLKDAAELARYAAEWVKSTRKM